MAQSVIGALRVNLGLDSAKFQKGAKGVNAPLRQMKKQFQGVATVAAAMGAAIVGAAIKGATEIDRAAKASRRLGASIGGFRALELAASEAGVPLSGLTNDIQNMAREIANIGVSGNAKRALDGLGLSVSDLDGLDADQKVAVIADAVKGLGLNAGQATALLRDLGIRNREMVLLMLQGGDALRSARTDVDAYGLALNSVDAAKIEKANDRIGRLGLIGQYAGQQLALALVPALGDLAHGLTESLRAGGALRAVIDALANNVTLIISVMGTAVAVFGVRYVGALAAAKLGTMTLAGAMGFLRSAILRTGVGALIVGLGYLVDKFVTLSQKAGGFGNALVLLKAVAGEVFERIKLSFAVVPAAIREGSALMSLYFVGKLRDMAESFVGFTQGVADGLNALFGSSLTGAGSGILDNLMTLQGAAIDAASSARSDLRGLRDELGAPMASVQALRDLMAETSDETTNAADSAADLVDNVAAFAGAGGGAGGGSGASAGGGLPAVADQISEVEDRAKSAADTIRGSFTSSFREVMKGAQTFGQGVGSILDGLANMLLDGVGNALFAGVSTSLGGLFASKIPGFANGTNNAPGGMAWVGERGRELVNLPRGSQVIPNARSEAMAGKGGGVIELRVSSDNGVTVETLVNTTGMMISRNNAAMQNTLGGRVNQVQERTG